MTNRVLYASLSLIDGPLICGCGGCPGFINQDSGYKIRGKIILGNLGNDAHDTLKERMLHNVVRSYTIYPKYVNKDFFYSFLV